MSEAKAKKETNEDLRKKIEELEAQVAAGQEGAMDLVCKALKIDPASIKEPEKKDQKVFRIHVPFPVSVNGRKYHGFVEVAQDTKEVIEQAVGERRMRLLKEMTGNKYVLEALEYGGYRPKLVGQFVGESE